MSRVWSISFKKKNSDHTWNTFFSAPLCFMYSLGRNSFRLEKKWEKKHKKLKVVEKIWPHRFCYSLQNKSISLTPDAGFMIRKQLFPSLLSWQAEFFNLQPDYFKLNKLDTWYLADNLVKCASSFNMKQLWRSGMDPYSKNPGLCLCSTWGPNWIWAWMPPNSPALSKDTGWEPFRMSSRAWKTKRKPLIHFEALPSPVSVFGPHLTDRLQGRRVRPARKADWAGLGLGSPRSGPSRRTCVWAGGSRSRPRPALWTFCCGPASSLTTRSTATGVGLYKTSQI